MQTETTPTPTLKLLLMGDSSVGKSSLLLQFTEGSFISEVEGGMMPTIGVDFKVKFVDHQGQRIKLTLWDTAGSERFRTLTSSYYRGAHGVVLVYDVTSKDSFDNLDMWLRELDTYASSADVIKMIVGNKIDKVDARVVSTQQGAKYAEQVGALFCEASARTAVGVQQAFTELINKVLESPHLWQRTDQRKLDLQSQSHHSSSCCGF